MNDRIAMEKHVVDPHLHSFWVGLAGSDPRAKTETGGDRFSSLLRNPSPNHQLSSSTTININAITTTIGTTIH